MANKGKKFDAITQYEPAILFSARGGYQHDAAFATERFCKFYMEDIGEREEATDQIGASTKPGREWRARANVDQLEAFYEALLPRPSVIDLTPLYHLFTLD